MKDRGRLCHAHRCQPRGSEGALSGVAAHSIIAVLGEGSPLLLNDGVVTYRSVHLEGDESEKIVHSSHSMQSDPATIQEVRRILREHVAVQ